MLVSGSEDNKIRLWVLKSKKSPQTQPLGL
ncbi:hypothetical protein F7734_49405 [Scytonema sp. UIC 10036]|nr:hypothetical protein [Scytonema sp. UIC 10036]